MKLLTIEQETRRLFSNMKLEVKIGKENLLHHIVGTKNKRTRMYKLADRYRNDAIIDFELGVINKEEYETEVKAVHMLKRAIDNMDIY